MQTETLNEITLTWIAIGLLLSAIQLKVTAPYGRHFSRNWGPSISYRLGWIIMEIVSPLTFAHFFWHGAAGKSTAHWFLFALWMLHYLNRSLIYPFRARMAGKEIPVTIVASAVFFNLVNGFLNGYWLGNFAAFSENWFASANVILGGILFFTGTFINIQSDNILIRLRQPGDTGYHIPQGGFFRWVSCPNHFGEILEWCGYALMAWSLPALSFAIWTAANLIPRALSHHRWYQQQFPDYPKERKAVVPWPSSGG
ncbi:MAG: DUF1295 domain-containing protein [Bacteroidetes bacterium]|nr:MAG: DUF1295 domain-containing protein [Bacteroidota bacterium]